MCKCIPSHKLKSNNNMIIFHLFLGRSDVTQTIDAKRGILIAWINIFTSIGPVIHLPMNYC